MDINLRGRIALVTGSSQGLGLEIARVLGKSGARIIICSSNKQRIDAARNDLQNDGVIVNNFFADARDILSVRQLFLWNINKLDILINNVGGAPKFGRFEDLTDEDWHNTFELNVMSAVRFTREALPLLKKSPHGGRIINISSFVAVQPGRFNPDYLTAKAGLVNLTKYIANEYGKNGIRANVICPNTLRGGGLSKNAKDMAQREGIGIKEAEEKILENAKNKNPLGKVGKLADVANLALFLSSDAGQFYTGQCFMADGGQKSTI